MIITPEQLRFIMTCKVAVAERWCPHYNAVMERYGITTFAHVTAFLAQTGHESARLLYKEEIASGAAYEGRADLGNTQPGDGRRFKGHGLIQLTGRDNHEKYAAYKGMSLDEALAYLLTEEGAADAAGWFWHEHDCNALAEKAAETGDFIPLTRRINGGKNGLDDRENLWERAKQALSS